MSANEKVYTAINNMIKLDPVYWEGVLTSRLYSGLGSRTAYVNTDDLQEALLNAQWLEYSHPSLSEEVVAYKTTDINGWLGVVPIYPTDQVKLIDPKNTGFLSAQLISRIECSKDLDLQYFSVIIIGTEEGEPVAFTFHPGDPISPSRIAANDDLIGQVLTGSKALQLGFSWAKIDLSFD